MATVVGVALITGWGQPVHAEILFPVAKKPAVLDREPLLAVRLSLNVALTPPPGVHQFDVWRGWRVILKRPIVGGILGDHPEDLIYQGRIIQIRPCEENRDYVMTVRVPDWIPAGRYDLIVENHGQSFVAPSAVVREPHRGAADVPFLSKVSYAVRHDGERQLRVLLTDAVPSRFVFEVVVSKEMGPVVLEIGGISMFPEYIGLADWRVNETKNTVVGGTSGARLLQYDIDLDALPVRSDDLRDDRPFFVVRGDVETTDDGVMPRLDNCDDRLLAWAWRHVSIENSEQCKRVIWNMGDGESRSGPRVAHRWIHGTTWKITAYCLGFGGEMKTGEMVVSVSDNSRGHGCAVSPSIFRRRRRCIWTLFLFFLLW